MVTRGNEVFAVHVLEAYVTKWLVSKCRSVSNTLRSPETGSVLVPPPSHSSPDKVDRGS